MLGAANSNQNNVVFNGNKISKHSESCLTTFYPAPSKNGSSSHAGLYSLSLFTFAFHWTSSFEKCTEDQEFVIVFYLLSFSIYYYTIIIVIIITTNIINHYHFDHYHYYSFACFLGKRVVQHSTRFVLFFFIFLFFSAENTKKRRLDQSTVR